MKLIQLKCPSCGSSLEVNQDFGKYTCNYCGVTTLLDDEVKKTVNITSKLTDKLTELKEYYDNGNHRKAYELVSVLIKEYPDNAEIKKYHEKLYDVYLEMEHEKAIELIKYMNSNPIRSEDYDQLKEYTNMFPNDDFIKNSFNAIHKRLHKFPIWVIIIIALSVLFTILSM